MTLDEWVEAIKAADTEAIRSQAAFVTGRFNAYLQERLAESQQRYTEAQARLDAMYAGPADEPNDTGATRPTTPRGDG